MAAWPEDMVDTRDVFEALAEIVGVSDYELSHLRSSFDCIFEFEKKLEDYRLAGRITRYVGRVPKTGEVFGYAYKRQDLVRYVRSQPAYKLRSYASARKKG